LPVKNQMYQNMKL